MTWNLCGQRAKSFVFIICRFLSIWSDTVLIGETGKKVIFRLKRCRLWPTMKIEIQISVLVELSKHIVYYWSCLTKTGVITLKPSGGMM